MLEVTTIGRSRQEAQQKRWFAELVLTEHLFPADKVLDVFKTVGGIYIREVNDVESKGSNDET